MSKDAVITTAIPLQDMQSSTTAGDDLQHSRKTKKFKCFSQKFLTVNRPLIPLRLALFLGWGGGAVARMFIFVYLKQLGLTLPQISIIGIITPVFQFFGPIVSGIIADKTGKTKPVLIVNIILLVISLNCLILIPAVEKSQKESSEIKFQCNTALGNIGKIAEYRNVSKLINSCTVNCDNATFDFSSEFCSMKDDSICQVVLKSQEVLYVCNNSYDIKPTFASENDLRRTLLKNQSYQECQAVCIVFNNSVNGENSTTLAFVLSLIITAVFFTAVINLNSILEVTALYLASAHDSNYGKERFWAIFSLLVLTPLAGYLVQVTTPVNGPKNYNTAFYAADVLLIFFTIVTWKLDIRVRSPGGNLGKKTLVLLEDVDMICLIVALVVLGTSWGFKETFTNLYLEELKARPFLLSLVQAVMGLVGLPFLVSSNWWIKTLGSTNILICTFASYILGFIGYSFLVNPWLCLICELMNIFTYHLMWVAVLQYIYDIAAEGLTATAIVTAGSIHYVLGKVIGNLLGGFVMSAYGGRVAFRVMASICAVCAVLYGTFVWSRRKQQSNK